MILARRAVSSVERESRGRHGGSARRQVGKMTPFCFSSCQAENRFGAQKLTLYFAIAERRTKANLDLMESTTAPSCPRLSRTSASSQPGKKDVDGRDRPSHEFRLI